MNFLKIIWKKQKSILVIIFYIGLILAIFFFAISPNRKKSMEKANEIQRILVDQDVDMKRVVQLPELKRQFEFIENNKSKIDLFITEDKVVDLLRQIEFLADSTKNNIDINIVDKDKTFEKQMPLKVISDEMEATDEKPVEATKTAPQTIVENLPYNNYLEMEIRLWGDYNQLLEFVYKLDSLNFLFDITKISILKQDKEVQSSLTQGSALFSVLANGGSAEENSVEPTIEEIRALKDIASSISLVFYIAQ